MIYGHLKFCADAILLKKKKEKSEQNTEWERDNEGGCFNRVGRYVDDVDKLDMEYDFKEYYCLIIVCDGQVNEVHWGGRMSV